MWAPGMRGVTGATDLGRREIRLSAGLFHVKNTELDEVYHENPDHRP